MRTNLCSLFVLTCPSSSNAQLDGCCRVGESKHTSERVEDEERVQSEEVSEIAVSEDLDVRVHLGSGFKFVYVSMANQD